MICITASFKFARETQPDTKGQERKDILCDTEAFDIVVSLHKRAILWWYLETKNATSVVSEHSILNIKFQHCIASHVYVAMRYFTKKGKKGILMEPKSEQVYPKELGFIYELLCICLLSVSKIIASDNDD